MKNKTLLFTAAMLITHTTWAITPENGWWWNPQESGRGFNIETQNQTVLIAAFVYDEGGLPIWYSGVGELKDSAVTATLMRSEGGQCIGCTYTSPFSSDRASSVTIKFSSPTEARLTWPGGTINIKRFNFALGKGLKRLLGEWVITVGSPTLPVYFGERLTYQAVSIDNGKHFVEGSRSGSPSNWSIISALKNPQTPGYQYLGITNSSTSYYDFYAYNFVGLNKIKGKTITIKKTALPEEIGKALLNGTPFVAYRNQGKTEVATQSLGQPKVINPLKSSSQDHQDTISKQPDGWRKSSTIGRIADKIYALEGHHTH